MYERFCELPLSKIDTADLTYQVSNPGKNQELVASLEAIGLINPPISIQTGEKYKIVSGFRRIHAVQDLGWEVIPSLVLSCQTTDRKCAQIAIGDNTTSRNLDVVEQARALKVLEACVSNDREVLIAFAAKIGLPLNLPLIEKLNLVNSMSTVFRDGMTLGALALPTAIKLHHWKNAEAAVKLGNLLIELNLSLNRQREMIEWFEGILARESTTIDNILEYLGINRILSDRNLDRRNKIDTIRSLLKKQRYPSIVAMENHYSKLLKQLQLPKGCQVISPPFFEGNIYSVKIDFSTPSQLIRLLGQIHNLAQRKEMFDLLSLHTHELDHLIKD